MGVGGISTSVEGQGMEIDRTHSCSDENDYNRNDSMLQRHCELEDQSLFCSVVSFEFRLC